MPFQLQKKSAYNPALYHSALEFKLHSNTFSYCFSKPSRTVLIAVSPAIVILSPLSMKFKDTIPARAE
jgi:hypothetical protein